MFRRTWLVVPTALILGGVCVSSAAASTPGGNGDIAFTIEPAAPGGTAQLYTLNPRTKALRQLTHAPEAASINADWSGDGRRLIYEVDTPTVPYVVIAHSDGTHRQVVASSVGGWLGQPAFVPHSNNIVVERFDPTTGDDGIWLMRTDGSHARRLTDTPAPATGLDTDPNVSPDGRTVSFVRATKTDDQQALYSIRIDGTHLRRLLPYADDVAVKHDWSPDGSHIVVTINANVGSRPKASAEVMTLRADGSHRHILTPLAGRRVNAYVGSYSSDGRWIVFRLESGDGTGLLPDGKFGLYQIHPCGGRAHLIAAIAGRPRYIDWGPRPAPHTDH